MFTEITKERGSKNKIIKLGTTNRLTKMTDEKGELLPIFKEIKTNFSVDLKKYYAGMVDGDGQIFLNKKRLGCVLELTENAAFPVIELSNIFDLTISRRVRTGKNNKTKPTLMINMYGFKAKWFLINIYPYLLEKKEKCKTFLISAGCPEHFFEDPFMEYRKFSYKYLAGYTDAEGCIGMYKYKGSYSFHYSLGSTDFKQLSFILENLKKNGFEVNIYSYNREKYNWKTIHKLHVTGGHKDRAKLYNKLLPFMKIKHKIKVMKNTIKYNEISNMINKRKNEME